MDGDSALRASRLGPPPAPPRLPRRSKSLTSPKSVATFLILFIPSILAKKVSSLARMNRIHRMAGIQAQPRHPDPRHPEESLAPCENQAGAQMASA